MRNGGSTITRTIESVLSSTPRDSVDAIVIADNNSSDDTCERVRTFTDLRIIVHTSPVSLSLAQNWNRCVELASADLIKVVCADDLIYPTCVASQRKILSRSDVALTACRIDIISPDGAVLRRGRGLRGFPASTGLSEACRRVVRSGENPIGPSAAMMFRREDFLATGGFRDDILFPMDVDLAVRLLQFGSLYAQRETLAAFRLSTDSLTSRDSSRKQLREMREFHQRICAEHPGNLTRTDLLLGSLRALLAACRRELRGLQMRWLTV